MAAQGGKLWNNTVPRDLRHGTTLFVSTFWETSLPAIAQACLLLLFFSKDILINVYLAVLLFTKRVAHFIHWQHCIPWHEQGVFFSSNYWICLRIFEFLLVQTKKRVFDKKTDVFRFLILGNQMFNSYCLKCKNTCWSEAGMKFCLYIQFVAAEGLLAFFTQTIFFVFFFVGTKIGFANNKCNFASTRNTFLCHAHSAVSLPPAKD